MRRRLSLLGALALGAVVLFVLLLPLMTNGGRQSADQVVKPSNSSAMFIETVAPEAQRLGKIYGIKPSVLIAQAAVGTDYGRNLLGARYHNLYRLTAKEQGERVTLLTTEIKDNKTQTVEKVYQVYPNWSASMIDYLGRLKANQLGNKELYQRLVMAKTYQEASAIFYQEAYTTDKNYAGQLIAAIEQHKLSQYDK